ncbi:hypothetical protein FHL15_003815 [Xylaria flabelliformis]|uniref:Uncharacterized protein n=1 Tax=Xylaria flabelliformis TaxID=2512241 RepID=A0A553I4M9_9PEZI|nr:hypothetical protein FHL15_003815 [Xylaria flabelliformis]
MEDIGTSRDCCCRPGSSVHVLMCPDLTYLDFGATWHARTELYATAGKSAVIARTAGMCCRLPPLGRMLLPQFDLTDL